MDKVEQLHQIKKDFIGCQKLLLAIGDSTRQAIMIVLMENPCTTGLRVGEITEKVHLSRPAVSHHLKILRDAEIIEMREEGTKNFYYINVSSDKFELLKSLVTHLDDLLKEFCKE